MEMHRYSKGSAEADTSTLAFNATARLVKGDSSQLARLSRLHVLGIGVLLFVLLLSGCAHPPSDREPVIGDALAVEQPASLDRNAPPDRLIIGTWEWQKTTHCGRGPVPESSRETTPAVAGYTEQRKFRRDGQVEFYKDRRLTGIYQYSVKPLRILPSDQFTITEVSIEGRPGTGTIKPDFLRYGTCDRDGSDEQYVRLQK